MATTKPKGQTLALKPCGSCQVADGAATSGNLHRRSVHFALEVTVSGQRSFELLQSWLLATVATKGGLTSPLNLKEPHPIGCAIPLPRPPC